MIEKQISKKSTVHLLKKYYNQNGFFQNTSFINTSQNLWFTSIGIPGRILTLLSCAGFSIILKLGSKPQLTFLLMCSESHCFLEKGKWGCLARKDSYISVQIGLLHLLKNKKGIILITSYFKCLKPSDLHSIPTYAICGGQ